jgi:transposase
MSGDNFSRRYSVVAEARRPWSEAEKQAIVSEAEQPGVNISAMARRHGIKPSLLFRWRRLARDGEDHQSAPTFIPVTLALPAAETPVPQATAEADASPISPPPAASRAPDTHRIEIALGNGRVVRVGAGVDGKRPVTQLRSRFQGSTAGVG